MSYKSPGSYKFPKDGRLHHRSLLEGLFRLGKSFYEFPFRVHWRLLTPEQLEKNFRNNIPDEIGKLQVMVSIPKKKRKKATDRVLMRRRVRESWRLNRHPLLSSLESREDIATLSVGLVYLHDKNMPFSSVEEKIIIALTKLQQKLIQTDLKPTENRDLPTNQETIERSIKCRES